MTARSRERLLHLADLLDTVPVKHFNLGVWAESRKPCQTAGCAVGWAAAQPWFQRRGLHLNRRDVPEFRGLRSFEAAGAFFDVSLVEARTLFNAASYPAADRTRPKTVAKRIRAFVEGAVVNPTYQNRRTGEFFERVWINGSHVGLRPLSPLDDAVTVKRSNLTKSYKRMEDYAPQVIPPAPNPPEPIGEPLPVRVGDKLPGPRVAPRPAAFVVDHAALKTSEGEHPAPASSTSRNALVRGGEPPGEAKAPSSRPSEESFWTWPYILAVVLSALFVVGMWIAVLS